MSSSSVSVEKLQHLVTQSIENLEAIINNPEISEQERTTLALEHLTTAGISAENLETILNNEQISEQLRTTLVFKLLEMAGISAETLEAILSNEQISEQERIALAFNLLEQAGVSPQSADQHPTLPQPSNLSPQSADQHPTTLQALNLSSRRVTQQFITFQPYSLSTKPAVQRFTISQANTPQKREEPANKGVSDDWKRWIAENKLLRRTDDSMIQAMLSSGIDEQTAREAINNIASDPCFQAGSNVVQLSRKLESILKINQELAKLSPNFGTIERRSRLSRQEFLENYYAKNTPVILTDMMNDWSAMSLWSPEYLKTKYGNVEVEIQANRNSDPLYEINRDQHTKMVKIGEFVEMVLEGGESNDYYLVANNKVLEREELKSLLDDIKMFPEFFDSSDPNGRVFFWFGPAGTITPLHHDPVNLVMAHVTGRKRWRIISPDQTPLLYNYIGVFSKVDCENPDYEKYPSFRDVNIIEVVVEPGEVIFIPIGWWHQVKALDISFSLSFTNFVFPNQFVHENPELRNW